ncbi:MAG: transcriptional repressor [Synergistetes bacterium]|nr:transcriptional repressor [Synergistota bacterium]
MDSLKEILKRKGINPSYQRMKILEYLQGNKSHPTVDMIYRDLSSDIPTLSKTTIYNTLRLFAEKGMISCLVIEGNELRFDPNTSPHGHFLCTKCGAIYDIELDKDCVERIRSSASAKGHKVSELQITFRGICKACLEKLH